MRNVLIFSTIVSFLSVASAMADDKCDVALKGLNASGSLALHLSDGPDPFLIHLVSENCTQGEPIEIGPYATASAKQLCDFSKSMVSAPDGSTICVLVKKSKG